MGKKDKKIAELEQRIDELEERVNACVCLFIISELLGNPKWWKCDESIPSTAPNCNMWSGAIPSEYKSDREWGLARDWGVKK